MKKLSAVLIAVLFCSFFTLHAAEGQTVLNWDPGTQQEGTQLHVETSGTAGLYLFEVTTTNVNSVGLWRTVLNVSSGEANLYIRNGSTATTNTYSYKSDQVGSDDIVTTLSAGQTWSILVEAEAGAQWSLFAGDIHLTELTWDPGTADLGTEVFTNVNTDGAAQYFKITTELPDLGAWRTALRVNSGEADLFLKQNSLPYKNSGIDSYTHSSTYTGDDGVALPLSNTSGSGQEWYILVDGSAGAQWSLYSGDVYAQDLGTLATNSASGSGLAAIPAEGIRYYKTTIPVETEAWRLWLQDAAASATLSNPFYIRKGLVPHPSSTSYYDKTRVGQGLLVPTYLIPGSADPYYVAISGTPGETFQLDSRQQEIVDTTYNSTLTGESVSGFLFKTYRIPVPPEQIAWEVTVVPVGGTNPDMAIRRGNVPNAFNNDAFSEVSSSSVSDSTTLVPPGLSDGSYYVTVYGNTALSFNLRNREPIITQIDFSSSTLNNDPNRAGWRFFAVSDISQQLGQLGWLLELSNQVPGSEIAIRRNFVPGRWNYRQNGNTVANDSSYNDQYSTLGFLQDPEHAADVWYVGIYSPTAALGAFTLDSGTHAPTEITLDGATNTNVQLPPKSWSFYHVDVPAQLNGQDVLGWELRTTQWGGQRPHMVIRRDQLPEGISTTQYQWGGGRFPYTLTSTAWNSGSQWVNSSQEWSGYSYDSTVTQQYPQYQTAMGMGQPLEPGSYYIGFFNNSPAATGSYTFVSSTIGSGMTYEVPSIPFDGGSAVVTNLPAHGVAYFTVDVPTNQASWNIKLENTSGETMVYVRKGHVPNTGTAGATYNSPVTSLARLQKTGDEHYVLLPESGQTALESGTYYLMVVSEGQSPSGSAIGTGSASAVLHSLGEAAVTDLGTLPQAGELSQADAYLAGENNLYQFTVPAGVLAMEVRLENRVGDPHMHLRNGTLFSKSYGVAFGYTGLYSGHTADDDDETLITVANPAAGTYSLQVADLNTLASLADGSYTLRIVTVGATDIAFDGGGATNVTLLPNSWKYYRVTVPATEGGQPVIGWELRTSQWNGQRPTMVVRRDELPEGTATTQFQWGGARFPYQGSAWNSGAQWANSTLDWSGFYYNPTSTQAYPQYELSMGMGRPLEPGSYYIGFFNNSTTVTGTYTFASSAIGSGMSLDVAPVAFDGGSAGITNLSGRGVAYFKVDVPTNQASWNIKLENTSGETLVYVRKDGIPLTGMSGTTYYSPVTSLTKLQKTGDEHYVLLPEYNQVALESGTYFLMMVSEGQSPSGSAIGTGSASAVLHSLGEAAVTDLGTLPQAGELSQADSYFAGENNLYQFTVPAGVLAMEVRLENRVGDPHMHLRNGTLFSRSYDLAFGYTGLYSGHTADDDDAVLITVANPAAGTYSLQVADLNTLASLADGSYTLRIVTVGATDITFDGGGATNVTLLPNSWKYYRVTVPATEGGQPVIGWELRTSQWSGERPTMVVRRDELPEGTATTSFQWGGGGRYPYTSTSIAWNSGAQWANSTLDWSGYYYDSTSTQQYPQYQTAMGMGRPLEPGSYYIGFFNSSTTVTGTYTFASSAIGSGMSLDVTPVPFDGGSAVVTDLPAHGVAYFTVDVPTNQASWEIKLENTSGETMVYVRKGDIPTSGLFGTTYYSPVTSLARLQKTGDEHYVLLPEYNQAALESGTYDLMVVSEGQSPSVSAIGTGSASAVLHSLGEAAVTDLGTLPLAGQLSQADSYFAGENNLYQFTVPEGVLAMEVRLENRVGDPHMHLRNGTLFSQSYGVAFGYTGLYSGHAADDNDEALITVANPAAGTYSLQIADLNTVANLANGSYTLVVEDTPPPVLNFDGVLNTNGNSNSAGGTLANDQRDFYRVEVPEQINGEPVLGWYLTTAATQGAVEVRVRKNLLPEGLNNSFQTPFDALAQVVVAPFLTPGSWYVEVKGVGAAEYVLTSSAIQTERSWDMPALGEAISTPGLTAPQFGDTGVNEFGVALPTDQGVDLDNGFYHFYEITVPDQNAGLLRTQLEAISGNPNLYIRQGNVPTMDHDADGAGTIYDHYLTGSANSEYASWVPGDGKTEHQLTPGKWYIMVKAEGASNARYRLKLSGGNAYASGNVQDLALDGGSFTGQLLADDDMRFYRVVIPTNAPANWEITYSQQSGNVDMYIRDTIPPGNYGSFNDGPSYIRDWRLDNKNRGYTKNYYANTGTHILTTPALRPGAVYYVGFIAKSDASFSVSSAVSGGVIDAFPQVAFDGGLVTTNLAPGAAVTYQVKVPADAVRWHHSHTNSSSVNVYLEQGTMPSRSSLDHWHRTSGTYFFDKYLLNPNPWPWMPNQTYYLTATNTGAGAESFTFVMNGSLAAEVPTNLSATDGTYSNYVDVSWTAISGINTYDLWRSQTNDQSTAQLLASGIYSGYDDDDVVAGLQYYYWVTAVGQTNAAWFSASDGGWIPGSGAISPAQQIIPAAGGSATITVTAQAETNWIAKSDIFWISIDSGSPGAGNGTVAYTVSAYAGEFARTGTVSVAGQTCTVIQEGFGVPQNVVATDGAFMDRTEISWDPLSGATGYYLYRNTTNYTGSASYIGNVNTNAFSDIGGVLDQVYYYWVLPTSAGGFGEYSASDSGYRGVAGVSPEWVALYFPGGYPGNDVDSDGDGLDNLAEFIAGTGPTDSNSVFEVSDAFYGPAGFVVQWPAVTGRVYGVFRADDLAAGFLPQQTNMAYPQNSYTDTVHSAEDNGFYYIDVQLQN